MITGNVIDHEAVIRLTVRGPTGIVQSVIAAIDTGFDGWFTLPPDVIAQLQLPWSRRGLAALADGTEVKYDVYQAIVVWDKQPLALLVDVADTIPLVGMAMLEGYELNVKVQPRGKVTIKRMSGGQKSGRGRR